MNEPRCQRFPAGTPLSSMISSCDSKSSDGATAASPDEQYFSVVSCNVLAPAYVRPIDKRTGGIQPFAAFEWVSEQDSHEVLSMEKRGPKLLTLLQQSQADAICLQELQLERAEAEEVVYIPPAWIQPLLVPNGGEYNIHLPPMSQLEEIAQRNVRVLGVDAAVTVAVLYKSKRFQPITENLEAKDTSTNTLLSIRLCPTITNSPTDGSVETAPAESVVIASVHLDATDEAKRVGQLSKLLQQAQQTEGSPTVILAGDYNTELEPGSCVAAFLRSNYPTAEEMKQQCSDALRVVDTTEKQLQDWTDLHAQVEKVAKEDFCIPLARVDTGKTRAAYDHEVTADARKMGQWKLDHVLYSTHTLRPMTAWETLEADPETATITGLPNQLWPSDHLPLGVVFALSKAPQLSQEEKEALLNGLKAVEMKQSEKLQLLENDLDMQMLEVEAKLAPPSIEPEVIIATEKVASSSKRKRKKSKKGPPAPEIIAMIRHRRASLKEMKAVHREERRQVIDPLGDLERLTIKQVYGYKASVWVEGVK